MVEQLGADVLVMGSHGYGLIKRYVVGLLFTLFLLLLVLKDELKAICCLQGFAWKC